jgi:subtilisin family serine protease
MRRAIPLAIALLLALPASPAAPSATAASGPTTVRGTVEDPAKTKPLSAAGHYIVVLKDGRTVTGATGRAARLGVTADRTFKHAVKGYSARLDADQLAALEADPDVDEVFEDEVISMTAQSNPTGVRRINGKESLVAQIDGADPQVDADVAIVDTGIGGRTSKTHEDLNIAGGVSCSTDNPNSWGDPNGHGTHVAGTVGALDNGIGVVGVAPGVRLWAVRILDAAGNGLISWYVCGLDWIAAQRDPVDPSRPLIEAVNMSVAKDGSDDNNCGNTVKDLMHRAICRVVDAGITVVAAAGNNSFNAARLKPASYNEVITVSALADTDGRSGGLGGNLCYSWGTYDKDDTFADFSNYGGDVDLIAPGKCIWSTYPGNTYAYISGTSMAAPHVTGAVALYKASRPLASPAQVKAALRAAGTQDWATSTDPDSVHEPLLDVSHIVDLGDFTVDATPGTSQRALIGAQGQSLVLPLQVIRAEDFPDAIDLSISADGPLNATLDDVNLTGQQATGTTMEVTVPDGTPSGTYQLRVTASDGSRERTSTFPVTVDGTAPSALLPNLALRSGGTLDGGVTAVGSWGAASDPGGSISRYEARWRVDGELGTATALNATSRSSTKRMHTGRTYSLRIRARDAAGNWSPWVETGELRPTLTQDTSDSLVKVGRWSTAHKSSFSGGSAVYSERKGDRVVRSFTGRGIAWIASESRNRGKAVVYLDGTQVATVDLGRSSTLHRSILFTKTWANAGEHKLTIKVLGTKGRHRVDVDAFVIVP